MIINIEIDNKEYSANFANEKSIAITLLPNDKQPNHFGAPTCSSQTLEMGSYIGDTKRGGSCNANVLTMIPHCNGTHTESASHVIDELIPVYTAIKESIFPCVLISIKPSDATKIQDSYLPYMDNTNKVISVKQLKNHLDKYSDSQLQGLVVRTLENKIEKKSMSYDREHYPAYLTNDAMQYLVERKIKHLLVDFPSVDKMYDDGQLTNHRMFWNINRNETKLNEFSTIDKTITEMIFVNDEIQDGFYLCNLQVPEIATDAVPSRPMLYSLVEVSH